MSVIRRAIFNKKIIDLKCRFFASRSLSTNSPEMGNILSSGCNDIEIPQVTIQELIYSRMEKFHKYTATECSETGRRYTYDQVRVKSRNLSKALRKKLKLERGDVVAIILPNVPEFVITALGVLEAGLIITTINPIYTPGEISRQLLKSTAKVIITSNELYNTATAASNLCKKYLPIITVKTKVGENLPQGAINFDELINSKIDIPDITPGNTNDIALLPYSSGTTGLPKGVELTHYNVVANNCQLDHPDFNNFTVPSDDFQERTAAVLPMFHIYGLILNAFNLLLYGCNLVTLSRFTPDLYISALKRFNMTFLYVAPPLVLFLTAHPDVKAEYFKHLKFIFSGAAPLGVLDEERFQEKSGKHVHVLQGYGLTETSPAVALTSIKRKQIINTAGSIGTALPNTLLKIVKENDCTGRPLGPNETGELLVKGPQVMKGYRNNPEETEKSFLDGWFKTGDMMYYNDNGLLFAKDRLKELIKVKGFQVAPAELEEVIRDFPSVVEAAVIGIPHPIYGEVPRAYIQVKGNKQVNTEELQAYVAKNVAPFKQLKGGVEIIDSLPKTASGKILRRQLKLKYQEDHKQE